MIEETEHPREVHVTCEVCGEAHAVRCCDGGQSNDFELPGFQAMRRGKKDVGHACPGCAEGLRRSLPFLSKEYGVEVELEMEGARFKRPETDVSKKRAGSKTDADVS